MGIAIYAPALALNEGKNGYTRNQARIMPQLLDCQLSNLLICVFSGVLEECVSKSDHWDPIGNKLTLLARLNGLSWHYQFFGDFVIEYCASFVNVYYSFSIIVLHFSDDDVK